MTMLPPILLVEDNPMDVELAVRAFRRCALPNPVEIARDGDEALVWIPRWAAGEPRPAVILLDLKLPKVSGLEVLRRLKTDVACRTIPVVVLTTSTAPSDVQAAYEIGANSYLVKPVDFDTFHACVAQIATYWTVLNQRPW